METMRYDSTTITEHYCPFEAKVRHEISRVGHGAGIAFATLIEIIERDVSWEPHAGNSIYFCNPLELLLEYVMQEAVQQIKQLTGYQIPSTLAPCIEWNDEVLFIHAEDGIRLTDFYITAELLGVIHGEIDDYLEEIRRNKLCAFFLDELERVSL